MQDSNTPSPTAAPDAGPNPAGRRQRSVMGILFLVVVIDLLGFGIVLPLLPLFGKTYLAQLYPGPAPDRPSLVGGVILGVLLSAFSFMQFVFAPVWGRISDRFGRRPIMLLGLAGSVIFYALFGYASDLPAELAVTALTLLFIARLGQGTAGATIPTAQAAIADVTTPEERKKGMALIGAAFGIGFGIGPLVGYASLEMFPGRHGSLGYVAAGLSLVALVLALFILPETRQFGSEPPVRRKWFSWHDTRTVLATPTVGLLVLIFFLTTLGFGSFEPTLALLNQDPQILNLSDRHNFLVFAFVGVVLLITQGYIYRKLAPRLSETTFMTYGIILMGAGLALLGVMVAVAQLVSGVEWVSLLVGILASLTVAVMGFGFLTPSVQALISRRSDPQRQGEILGVNQSASALARILGPFLGVALFHVPNTYHLLPYAFGAAVLLAMLTVLPGIRKE